MPSLIELSHWLTANASLILPAIAIIAFVESFAIAGIVVPGVALLFSAAAVAGLAGIPLIEVLAAAFIGAVLGDVISFYIGRAFHDRLPLTWPFSKYPNALQEGERFFEKYGTYSVVIGRFVGPLRPVLPLTAGVLQMSPTKFILINLLSAIAWAPAYILPGYLGAEITQLATQNRDITYALVLVLCLIIAISLLWLSLSKQRAKPFVYFGSIFTLSAIAFSSIAYLNISGMLDGFDVWVLAKALTVRDTLFYSFFVFITLLGDQALLILLFLICVASLATHKQYKHAIYFALTGITVAGFTHGFKYLFNTIRPDHLLGALSSGAFPSGHTSGAAVFIGCLVLTAIPSQKSNVWKVCGLIIISLIACSRIILGVHWASDVIAGLLLAGIILCLSHLVLPREDKHLDPKINKQYYVTLLIIPVTYVVLSMSNALVFYSSR